MSFICQIVHCLLLSQYNFTSSSNYSRHLQTYLDIIIGQLKRKGNDLIKEEYLNLFGYYILSLDNKPCTKGTDSNDWLFQPNKDLLGLYKKILL